MRTRNQTRGKERNRGVVIKQIKKGKFNEVQNNSRQDKGQTKHLIRETHWVK